MSQSPRVTGQRGPRRRWPLRPELGTWGQTRLYSSSKPHPGSPRHRARGGGRRRAHGWTDAQMRTHVCRDVLM